MLRDLIWSQDEIDDLLRGYEGKSNMSINLSLGDIDPIKHAVYEGKKDDSGKLRWDLLPMDALESIVAVYTYGATKYDPQNWRQGISYSRIIGAILRHFTAFMIGKDNDDESGLPHLAHAGWGVLTLIWYQKYRKEFDDRWK